MPEAIVSTDEGKQLAERKVSFPRFLPNEEDGISRVRSLLETHDRVRINLAAPGVTIYPGYVVIETPATNAEGRDVKARYFFYMATDVPLSEFKDNLITGYVIKLADYKNSKGYYTVWRGRDKGGEWFTLTESYLFAQR